MSTATHEADAARKTGTAYLILQKSTDPATATAGEARWKECGTVHAASSEAAVRAHMNTRTAKSNDTASVYVAVPARSWRPITVTVETTTTVKLAGL